MNETRAVAACLLAAQRAKSLGLTQESIANAVVASQSQVSRVLSGHTKRYSGLAERVCNYVNSHLQGVTRDSIAESDELMAALAAVWDGSTQQARLLANLIRAAGPLMTATESRKGGLPC